MLRVPCTTCPYTMQPTLTHTHVLSGAVKMHPAVTCWNWAFKGDTSKSPSNANTCKADTFHKSPEEAELVCVTVWVCMYLYVACVPVNPPLLSSFRKWPLFTCHTLLPPPTHTHTHCSTMQQQVMAIHSRHYKLKTRGISPTLHLKQCSRKRLMTEQEKNPCKSHREDKHPVGKFGREV